MERYLALPGSENPSAAAEARRPSPPPETRPNFWAMLDGGVGLSTILSEQTHAELFIEALIEQTPWGILRARREFLDRLDESPSAEEPAYPEIDDATAREILEAFRDDEKPFLD